MQVKPPIDAELPEGVELRDYDDYKTLRGQIFDGVKGAFEESFPASYGGVRVELDNVRYEGPEDFNLKEQKDAILYDKFLTRRLRGTMRMFDEETGDQIDETDMSLARVPWLTQRNTFIHGGNEYSTIMQSRLLPGVYTRRQANGHLETQFNVRPGTGKGFRVGFEPDTAQYRLRISQANLHLYSLLKDMGTSDEDLKKRWGEDIWAANAAKYDSRVFDKAYQRLVPNKLRKPDATPQDKAEAIQNAMNAASINRYVVAKNLPGMLGTKQASEQRAMWAGRQAVKEAAEKALDAIPFAPDFTPDECIESAWTFAFEKRAAIEALPTMLKAKEYSDNKQYDRKSELMLLLMQARPDEFIVDQDDDKFPGITHTPTGFKMHVPSAIIPKDVARPNNDIRLLSYVPNTTLDSVRQHGLLSGNALAKAENRHLLELSRGEDADAWLEERDRLMKERPWATNWEGPSLFFGEPDQSRFEDDHPLRKRPSTAVRINLSKLLKDIPDTRMHGVELSPYEELHKGITDEAWEAMSDEEKDALIAKRHRDISADEVKALVEQARNPAEMWKHYKPGDGKYAPDVPHVQLITPGGMGIPPEYLEFEGAEKQAVVKQTSDGKWELRTKDGKRVLGTHATAQDAYKQEYAIQKSQEQNKKQASDEFTPDLTPDDMRESYNSIYGNVGPQLASMKKWPDEWLDDTDPAGWLSWYEQYNAGRRGETDDKQIKRWKSFKARHGSQLIKNPTPRRAYALRNWGVDPLKLIDDEQQRKELEASMEEYKTRAEAKWRQKHANFDLRELIIIADFLNQEHDAKIPIGAVTATQLEKNILDFVAANEGGINPTLLNAGVSGLASVRQATGTTSTGLPKNIFKPLKPFKIS